MWKKGSLAVVATAIAFLIVELSLRFIVPEVLGYEGILAGAADHPERLFPAYTRMTYNVTGLYRGAGEATLRVGPQRFIDPEPQGPCRYRVLFLGGSTTEAIYVPEPDRWVALMNEPGYLGAFNAGQSGANTVDKYFTLKYLAHDKGMRFDLIVLMTAINDLAWMRQLDSVGRNLEIPNYQDHLRAWRLSEQRKKEESISFLQTRTGALISQAVQRAVSADTVVERYCQVRDEALARYSAKTVTLASSAQSQRELRDYEANARRNLAVLNKLAREMGARLLVLSEATSFAAPSSSYLVDVRYPLDFDGGLPSLVETQTYFEQLNAAYLRAARDLNISTFDLAGELGPLLNGPHGGEYMYDGCHYTPSGCREVARVLKPVLRGMLEAGCRHK
jgi:hypothetical protein